MEYVVYSATYKVAFVLCPFPKYTEFTQTLDITSTKIQGAEEEL